MQKPKIPLAQLVLITELSLLKFVSVYVYLRGLNANVSIGKNSLGEEIYKKNTLWIYKISSVYLMKKV